MELAETNRSFSPNDCETLRTRQTRPRYQSVQGITEEY